MSTEYKNVYYSPLAKGQHDNIQLMKSRLGLYRYQFTYQGVRHIGHYHTARKAAIEMDKKFIALGLYDRLQVLKKVAA